ncbi:hypothetical protein [Ruegeria hyattellae]|uniref:hypothetical protein n=1 Tax=Ruegeria hyattellae TaxID=3233337 RepID=UPI00355BBD03
MTDTGRYHGGLVFQGSEEGALDRFSGIAAATLEDHGHMVERQTLVNAQEARIVTSQYLVTLTYGGARSSETRATILDRVAGLKSKGQADTMQDKTRLTIALTPVSPELDDQDVSELILVVMLYRMVDLNSCESIEWLDSDMSLTVEQFMGAFANLSPKRGRDRKQIIVNNGERFAPIEEEVADLTTHYDYVSAHTPRCGRLGLVELSEEEALALSFRTEPLPAELEAIALEDQPDSDIRRLTSWSMTGCLYFVSAPVAVSMAAVNLIKGEDFRLNTHVLALTSSITIFKSTGMIDSVTSFFV